MIAKQTNRPAEDVEILGMKVFLKIRGPSPVLRQDETVFALRVLIETAGQAATCFPGGAHPCQKGLEELFSLLGMGLHFQSHEEQGGSPSWQLSLSSSELYGKAYANEGRTRQTMASV